MTIADIRSYIDSHLASAGDDLRGKFEEVVAFVECREAEAATIAAEVADLTARGYTVTAPAALEAPAA